MNESDWKFMEEAIEWAKGCQPIKERIPKVGAIIAVNGKAIGYGRRGTGRAGDDQHAELNALEQVKDKTGLAGATLYTTLEPCTARVRSKPLESCTELIHQYRIGKVFIGIPDPNPGVTGKGLWRLQDSGVEVALFPHDLSKKILAENAAFIRSQESLGAEITQPKDGEEVRVYQNPGRYPICLKCLNPPGNDTYLLISGGGSYWPQTSDFRPVGPGAWEVDAYFGSTGEYALSIATADDLGDVLIRYYRKVVRLNLDRRQSARGKKIDESILGTDYPGIEMSGLPKGLRSEASVIVTVVHKFRLIATSAEPKTIYRGKALDITYEIESLEDLSEQEGIWLGASFRDKDNRFFHNLSEDKVIPLRKGKNVCHRDFTIAKDATLGEQLLSTSVWRGIARDGKEPKYLVGGSPLPIKIVE